MSEKILIKKGDKELEVYEKAYEVVYKPMGYTPVDADNEDIEDDLSLLAKEELEKVNKETIKAYLDKEEIEYKSNATKDELIALLTGDDEEDGNE